MPAIRELKSYCPASEIENIFADYAGTVEPEKTFLAPGEKFVSQMNLLGLKPQTVGGRKEIPELLAALS